jgi:hypothetical protein
MSHVDPWEKAAECARAIEFSLDPIRKAMLHNVQYMWMELGNKQQFLTDDQLVREAEAIGQFHSNSSGA